MLAPKLRKWKVYNWYVCLYWEHLVLMDLRLFYLLSPFIVSANFIWMCCEVHLFVAMQMHSSNGKGYTFIIISYDLRLEPKTDKLFIRLSWDVFIILLMLYPNREFVGQRPQLMWQILAWNRNSKLFFQCCSLCLSDAHSLTVLNNHLLL